MKKFAYTLVTSTADGAESDGMLTLRETLVIDEGPRYHREYIVTADGGGTSASAEENPAA